VTILDYLEKYRRLGIIRLLSKDIWGKARREALLIGEFDIVITYSFGSLLGVFVSAKKYVFLVPMWPKAKIKYKWWERILATYHRDQRFYQDFLIALQKLREKKIVIFLPPRRGNAWEDGKMQYDLSIMKEMQDFAEIIELPVRGHRKAVTDTLNIQKIISTL